MFTKNVFGYDEDGDSGSCVGFITSLPDDNNFTFTLSLHMMSVVVLSAVVEVQKLSGSEEQAIDFFKSAVKDVKLLDNSPTRTVSGGSYIVKFDAAHLPRQVSSTREVVVIAGYVHHVHLAADPEVQNNVRK